jgi:hypothetical protein
MRDDGTSLEPKSAANKVENDPIEYKDTEEAASPGSDIILGTILILLSGAVIFRSLQMPRPEGWGQAPGLFPLLCGVILIFMGMSLTVTAIRKRKENAQRQEESNRNTKGSDEIARTLVVLGGILIYVFILIPLIHYTASTFFYLVFTIWYFWRGKPYWVIIISIAGTLFLSQTFKHFFDIILP